MRDSPNYQRSRIGDVATVNALSLRIGNAPTEIDYIDISSVGTGVFTEPPKRMVFNEAPSRARRIVRAGDTLLSTVRPNRRSFIFLSDPCPSTIASTGFAVLSPTPKVDPQYLYYWVTRQEFTDYLALHAKGAAYPAVSADDIVAGDIELPPLSLQRQIVAILSAYDELIENSLRRIQVLETMARALYREWFVNFRFPNHGSISRARTSLGDIPESWQVKRLPECIHINPRVAVPREGEKPFVPMGCLSNDSMIISDIESREGNSGAKFQNSDTLFARITPCLENGKTGFVQFLPDVDAVAFGSTEFIVLRSRTLTPEFVYCLARSDAFRGIAIKSMSGATGRQRVQEQCFHDFQIAQPPRKLLADFSAIVSPMFQLIHKLHILTQNLRQTRDLLLPRLVAGEISL